MLGRSWLRLGHPEKALEQFGLRTETCIGSAADEPAALALGGRLADSRLKLNAMLMARQTGYVSAYDLATVYAAHGMHGSAMDWLEVALKERAQPVAALGVDPVFQELSHEPRFRALLRRLRR